MIKKLVKFTVLVVIFLIYFLVNQLLVDSLWPTLYIPDFAEEKLVQKCVPNYKWWDNAFDALFVNKSDDFNANRDHAVEVEITRRNLEVGKLVQVIESTWLAYVRDQLAKQAPEKQVF